MPQPIGTDAVSRLAAPQPREEGGAWKLLIFMAFVFALFVLSYLGLALGYHQYVNSRIAVVQGELDSLGTEITPAQQEELLSFEFRLVNLKNLLMRHVALTPVLTLIEANTHQQVFYRTLDVAVSEHRVNVQVVANSYDIMSEQLAAYEAMSGVTRLQVGGIKSETAGKVSADVVLFLDAKIFGAGNK